MYIENNILFIKHFSGIYEFWDIFSKLYVVSDYKGIAWAPLMKESSTAFVKAVRMILFLKIRILIFERGRLLHLNRWKFNDMTIGDLLILVESWREDRLPSQCIQDYDSLKRFSHTQNLSLCYVV